MENSGDCPLEGPLPADILKAASNCSFAAGPQRNLGAGISESDIRFVDAASATSSFDAPHLFFQTGSIPQSWNFFRLTRTNRASYSHLPQEWPASASFVWQLIRRNNRDFPGLENPTWDKSHICI